MWAEFIGAGVQRKSAPLSRPRDWTASVNDAVKQVMGIVASDSKEGYDAIEVQESVDEQPSRHSR